MIADPPVAEYAPPVLRPAIAATVGAIAAIAFAALAIWVARHGSAAPAVDERIHRWIIADRSAGSVAVARVVTWAGVTKVVLPALLVIGVAVAAGGREISRRLGSGVLLGCVAGAGILAEIQINSLIDRMRPPMADWAGTAGGPAFPSGHTTAATLFAACAAWALAARVRPGWPRRAIWAGAVGYAAAVGWSRIWLGVHWPTDVLGGWLFAVAWSAGSAALIGIARKPGPARP